jgi:hypothetical protein
MPGAARPTSRRSSTSDAPIVSGAVSPLVDRLVPRLVPDRPAAGEAAQWTATLRLRPAAEEIGSEVLVLIEAAT